MGVDVSRPRRGTKVKYIQADDYEGEPSIFDESEQFLSERSQRGNAKGRAIRNGKSSSKRNETGFFQFKSGKGTFDSLDTVDSRRSVPFAVLPENNTRASTSSPSGGNEDLQSVCSEEESTVTLEKSGKAVLFLDEPLDDLEQQGKLKDKKHNMNCGDKKAFSCSRRENRKAITMASSTQEEETGDGSEM